MITVTEKLNRILNLSESKLRDKTRNRLNKWKKECLYQYRSDIHLLTESITLSIWTDYTCELSSQDAFGDSLENILKHEGLSIAKVNKIEDKTYIHLPHITFIFDKDSPTTMILQLPSGIETNNRPIPAVSAKEIGDLLLWYNNVAIIVESEVKAFSQKEEQQRIIGEILKESIKARKEDLLDNHSILAHVEYEDKAPKLPSRFFDRSIKYPTVRCSFASYKQLQIKVSREETKELLSNPALLIDKMESCKTKPSSLRLFSRKGKRERFPCDNDSFLQEMRNLTRSNLKDLGITVVLTLLKKEVKLTAVQYLTTKREYIEPDDCIAYLSDINNIISHLEPFKHRVNFIGKDPNKYGDCY
ncbi:MAG: hypothetical protein MJZ16_08200 [Bacteroidales bacterium]|nr:hypothetical protein [Bacteroidales bacterium]